MTNRGMTHKKALRNLAVQRPQPTQRAMSSDAHEELYRVLLASAEQVPLPVLGQCAELLITVLTRRLHDEMGEFVL